MSRVITFSRYFPSYHPRKGEPTYFVEKFLNSNRIPYRQDWYFEELKRLNPTKAEKLLEDFFMSLDWKNYEEKGHTIRIGNGVEVGVKRQPSVWSGKPYQSKQIIIAPDIEIKKIFQFEMDECGIYSINGKYLLYDFMTDDVDPEIELAKNDGLSTDDFFHWFMPNFNKSKSFYGQILCWNENIEY